MTEIHVKFNGHVENVLLPSARFYHDDKIPIITLLFPEAEWVTGLRDQKTQVVYPLSLVTRDPVCLPRERCYTIVAGKRPLTEHEEVLEAAKEAVVEETAEDGLEEQTILKEEQTSILKEQLLKFGFRALTEQDSPGSHLVGCFGIVRLQYPQILQALGPPHSVVGETVASEDTDGRSDISWTLWNDNLGEPVTIYNGREMVRSDGSIDWHIGGLIEHKSQDHSLPGAMGIFAAYISEVCGVEAWTNREYSMGRLNSI